MILTRLAPLVAVIVAIPQFAPQVRQLRRVGDVAGLSFSWAALTSVHNLGWLVIFAMSNNWLAATAVASIGVSAGLLSIEIARRSPPRPATISIIAGWACVLASTATMLGRSGLGTLLIGAFVIQATPAVLAVTRERVPSGVARTTWILVLVEMAAWLIVGIGHGDPVLTVHGALGVTISALVISQTMSRQRTTSMRDDDAPAWSPT